MLAPLFLVPECTSHNWQKIILVVYINTCKVRRYTTDISCNYSGNMPSEFSNARANSAINYENSYFGVGGRSTGLSTCLRRASAESPGIISRCCLLTTGPLPHRCALICLQLRATWQSHCSQRTHYLTAHVQGPSLLWDFHQTVLIILINVHITQQ